MSYLKGGLGEKYRARSSRWLAQVTLPLPMILSLHTCMAPVVTAVLTIQKKVLCLQVCLALGHYYHQSGCPDSVLGDLLMAFSTWGLGTL
jgi:hypothetical protein